MDNVTRVSSNLQLQLQHQVTIPQPVGNTGFVDVPQQTGASTFADALQQELGRSGGVRFSKHAMDRIRDRGVEMTPAMMDRLNHAVSKARAKGCKDVAVIGDKNAFIVSVQNNTVITTMNALEMRENIFTNIDSAVLL